MSLQIKLAKHIDGTLQIIHPATDAALVVYDKTLSVKDAIDAVVEAVDELQSALYPDSVYMTDASGETLTDDDGLGLVGLGSITGS